uniref:AGC-kinase C-terminal domain-containing protein n=1 Tax=Heterorhabditis bacteriophora TaxID=37862 RepID=A0A1I7X718_HETBA
MYPKPVDFRFTKDLFKEGVEEGQDETEMFDMVQVNS